MTFLSLIHISTALKTAFEALPAEEQAYFQPTIDAMAADAANLGLTENAKYCLLYTSLPVGESLFILSPCSQNVNSFFRKF